MGFKCLILSFIFLLLIGSFAAVVSAGIRVSGDYTFDISDGYQVPDNDEVSVECIIWIRDY